MRRFGNLGRKTIHITLITLVAAALAVADDRAYGDGSERYPKGPQAPAEGPLYVPPPPPAASSAPLAKPGLAAQAILKVTPLGSSVGLYQTLRVEINLNTPYNNPFDQADIKVDMRITGPSGEAIVQPCFFRSGTSANSNWEARFAPRKLGAYAYKIAVTRGGATEESDAYNLEATPSSENGFLRMDADSWYQMRFDNGKRFRGVGENFGWESQKYTFRNTLPLLRQNKVNFIRTWEGPGRFGLEHFQQFNRYNLAVADKVDTVMQLAAENGIYVMAALDPHIYYYTKPDYWAPGIIRWNENPYSQGRGGPCAKPVDFFTNAQAKAAYRNRLRYAVARWGASQYLAVWEFWNEVDHLVNGEGVSTAQLGAWHSEMSAYLRSIDPYQHVITTSLSHNDYREIWNLPGIEFTQRHLYGGTDGLHNTFGQYENNYRKPFVSGEFSLHWTGTNAATPAAFEREVHMALWRGMFLQTPILPMTWWWDFHADQGDYVQFSRARDMVEKMVEGDGKLEKAGCQAGGELEAMAAKTPSGGFLWIRNKQNYTVNAPAVTINGLQNLPHDVRVFDTWTGAWANPQTLLATGGSIRVTLPNLPADKDVAVWLQARVPVFAAAPGVPSGRLTLAGLKLQGRRLEVSLAGASGAPVVLTLSDLRGRAVHRRVLAPEQAGADLAHAVELPAVKGGVYVLGIAQDGAALRRPIAID